MSCSVLDHAVVADGTTLNTRALQALIDRCAESGGRIVFPAGRYLTGMLRLHSGIELHLEAGATLLGSTDLDDYPLMKPSPIPFWEAAEGLRALLFAHGAEGIRVTGSGTIDGQGNRLDHPRGVRASMPRVIWFGGCHDVAVKGLRLRHAGFWMQHYLKCTKLRLTGLDVYNHGSCNNDGLDIDCCRDVIVSDCSIDSHDDALCLKSGNDTPTENVVITNCLTRSHCNHFKTGTESNGGFRNITVSNLQMVPSTVRESDPHTGGADWRGACGIALGCVDGGMLENISISHVQMDQVRVPFFVKFGDRARTYHGPTTDFPIQYARSIHLSHLTARGAAPTGCYAMGLPEEPLRQLSISDCDLEFEGGGTDAQAEAPVPLKRDSYPSCDAFGAFPSYGIYLRDVAGASLAGLNLRTLTPDARPALRWQRVTDLALRDIRA